MNRTDIVVIAVIIAAMLGLLVTSSGRPPQPPEPSIPYTRPYTPSYVPSGSSGGVNVLTEPRYQDVPALNRPMMLPLSCYSDSGCD